MIVGYLVPILNNLLDETEYSEVPPGCSPLVIVVCSSWENANYVQILCHQVMKKVKARIINSSPVYFINSIINVVFFHRTSALAFSQMPLIDLFKQLCPL